MDSSDRSREAESPRLYRDLAEWYPLLTPVEDYPEEAALYRRLFETHAARRPRTLLDLGCGAGHVAFHLRAAFEALIVPLEHSAAAGYEVFVGRRPPR